MQTHARRPAAPAPVRVPERAPAGAGPNAGERPAPLTEAGVRDLQAAAGNRAVVQRLTGERLLVQRDIGQPQAQALARQLDDAMRGLGTDEEAVYGALAGRTPDDLIQIRQAYASLTNKNLDAEVRDELTDSEYEHVRAVLEAKDDRTATAGARQVQAMDRAAAIADQLFEAMEGLGTEEDQIFNALTGRTPSEIVEIRRQYQARHGHALETDLRDELSGSDLDRALQLVGRTDTGTFGNALQQHMTEGGTTVVRGRYEYELTKDDKLKVTVPVNFVPDPGVTVPLALWNQQVADTWNLFWIREDADGGRAIDLRMELKDDAGDPRKIRVVQNTNPGSYGFPDRANAGKWYPVMPASTAPHEFGHLIGLPDEYQRTREDFEAITGETRIGVTNASGKTPATIAAELNTALTTGAAAGQPAAATAVLQGAGLITGGRAQQGDFAESVLHAYDATYTPTLFPTLQGLPAGTNWTLMSVFSFASGTVMGNESTVGVRTHEHPVMARHLREFLGIVQNRFPDSTWYTE
jgi:hypothetical protein